MLAFQALGRLRWGSLEVWASLHYRVRLCHGKEKARAEEKVPVCLQV